MSGAFLDGAPRAVSVEAMSDGEVMRLSYEAFESLSARNPALAHRFIFMTGGGFTPRARGGDVGVPHGHDLLG